MKIWWNLLCQYNNIYASYYKYLKEKKVQTEDWRKKEKKKNSVATVPLGTVVIVQNLGKKKIGSRNQSIVAIVI